MHLFAIFIVLVLSYCCFLLIFYDRVWNGTFTTFSIITLRCFNEYWARGCRDANRLARPWALWAGALTCFSSTPPAGRQTHFFPLYFYFFFTWCTPISEPSSSTSMSFQMAMCWSIGTCCWFLRARMHINTSVHYGEKKNEKKKNERRNVQTMMGVS